LAGEINVSCDVRRPAGEAFGSEVASSGARGCIPQPRTPDHNRT
jgi:hypothetical protein